jgi:hypothetical protein
MYEEFTKLVSRDALMRNAGLVLTRDQLIIHKAIESISTKENLDRGIIFGASDTHYEKLRYSKELFSEHLGSLSSMALILQIFELYYDPDRGNLSLRPVFLSISESISNVEEAFFISLKKSTEAFERYIIEKKALDEQGFEKVILRFTDRNSDSNLGEDDLEIVLKSNNFYFPPNPKMIEASQKTIHEEVIKNDRIIHIPKIGYFSVQENMVEGCLKFCIDIIESKILPNLRNVDGDIRDKLLEIEKEEKEYRKRPENKTTYAFFRRKAEVLNQRKDLLDKYRGTALNQLTINMCPRVDEYIKKMNKVYNDRYVKVYTAMLETGFDFDSKFLRLNNDRGERHDIAVINALKSNPAIMNTDWVLPTGRVIVFVMKNPTIVKELNKIIYEEYRSTTEFIIILRVLIEKNETFFKSLFKDEEFMGYYGKNLQEIYFKYIPWYYKLLAFLGIQSLVNKGYTKAKNIIQFQQMDRQFQADARLDAEAKEKLKKHQEDLLEEESLKQRKYLLDALDEFYFYYKRVPTIGMVTSSYLTLNQEIVEKVIKKYNFTVIEYGLVGQFSEGDVIVYPDDRDHQEKRKKVLNVLDEVLTKSATEMDERKKALELKKRLEG